MSERCGHGMLVGLCVTVGCSHFDGGVAMRKRVYIPKKFMICRGCRRTAPRKDMVTFGKCVYCTDCARCSGCSNQRRTGSKFCQACSEKFAQPKSCETCGGELTCAGSHDHDIERHTKRSRCIPCSRKFATGNWYPRKAAVGA